MARPHLRCGHTRHEVNQPVLVAGLQAALTAQGLVAPTVRIREVAAIPRTALGKAALITKVDT